MAPVILIVDDEPAIREVVRVAFGKAGIDVVEANDGLWALEVIKKDQIDLVVLDVGMPGMDGFSSCRAIRAISTVPVLFLTAQDDEIDRVLGFELGADDYVTKPFSPRELVLRVKAILNRGKVLQDRVKRHGDLVIDLDRHSSFLGDRTLEQIGRASCRERV